MMYPFMTLDDNTEIVHSDAYIDDGKEIVKVYIERPVKDGFCSAECHLPEYKWVNVEGFTEEEIQNYLELLESMAHVIIRLAREKGIDNTAREKALERLHDLLKLQESITAQFGDWDYNVFVFGSYLTTAYNENESDIDIAVYTKDFNLYKRLSCYLEEYFHKKNIPSDIFYIDSSVVAPIYCAPLNAKVQFTDYYPDELKEFRQRCETKLNEIKAKVAG